MPPAPTSPSGNALEGVRRRNLGDVLRLVHDGGPTPRSALTRTTGLNRSTVGALVGELASLGLVREGRPAVPTGAGRPSPTVAADPDVVAVAVNPEVDAVTVAVVGLDGTEHVRVVRPCATIPTVDETVATVCDVLDSLSGRLADLRVVGLGVAVPGIVRVADGLVRVAPHLGWYDEPLAQPLAAATGLAVAAANDANLGVHAERLFGSARGADHVVYVNGGASGIGGGIVVDGRVLTGRGGYAGEVGHTLVETAGALCHCGSRGCLETVVSQERLLAAGGRPRPRAGATLTPADRLEALLGDPPVRLVAEVDRQIGHLAVALRNVVATVNPELVVLGGFLGLLHDHAGSRMEAALDAQTTSAGSGPSRESGGSAPSERSTLSVLSVLHEGLTVVTASLGSSVLLRGAAELAFGPLLADPAGTLDARH